MALTNLSQITTSGISTLADINLNNITGVAATFTGNVTVGGTLTYDDVTNIDSVGLVTARSGVNITGGDLTLPDAIIHAGDTNTKIRFPAADTFTVETGGNERFRIVSDGGTTDSNNIILDADGRLLIGATSITNLIRLGQAFAVATTDEFGGGSFTGFNGTTAVQGPVIDLQRSRATSKSPGTVVVDDDRLGSLVFRGDDGTDFADAAYMLGEVDGTPNGGFVPGRFTFYTGTASAVPTERLRITSAGDVTTTGTSTFARTNAGFTARRGDSVSITRAGGTPLEITRTTNQGTMINFLDTDGSTYRANIGLNSNDLVFGLTTEKVRITSAGNLGIKNTSPNNTLTVGDGVQTSYAPSTAGNYVEIARTSGADAGLLINKNTGQWLVGIDNSDGANAPLRFEYAAAGSAHPGFGAGTLGMIIKHDGKIGIGTDNPAKTLSILSSQSVMLQLEGTSTSARIGFKVPNTSHSPTIGVSDEEDLQFRTGNNERVRITSTGRVGIGLTNPFGKLQVRPGTNANFSFTTGGGESSLELINDAGSANVPLNVRASEYKIKIQGNEKLRIDSSGNITLGDSTYGSGLGQLRIINDASSAPASLALFGHNNTSTGDPFGQIQFAEQETGTVGQIKAKIEAQAVSTNERGADLVFFTADNTASSSPSERLRITYEAVGRVRITGQSGYYTDIIGNSETTTAGIREAGCRFIGPENRRMYFEIRGNDATDHIRFITSPNNNAALDYVAMHIGNNGKVGIGTNNPDELLEVGDGTVSGALKVSGQSSSVTSDGLTVDWESSSNSTRIFSEPSSGGSSAIRLFTTNSGTRAEALRITSGRRLVIGHTSEVTGSYDNSAQTKQVQIVNGANDGNQGLGIYSYSSAGWAPRIELATSRSSSKGGHTVVTDGQSCGLMVFNGSDGTDFSTVAMIGANVNGTPANNAIPGALSFYTSPGAGLYERLQITSDGHKFTNNGSIFHGSNDITDFTGASRNSYNNVSIRAGYAGGDSSPTNRTSAIKIYPVGSRNTTAGTLTGGIAWQHLDPNNGSWSTSYGEGAQIWMGAAIHDVPGQERDRFNLWMNSSTVANSNPNKLAIEAYPNGVVRHPQVPAFYAYRNSNSNQTTAGDQVYDSTRLNNGSHYSTSNGRFTAPIDGMYLFSASVQLYGGPSTGHAMSFRINGTDLHGSYNSSNPVYDEKGGTHSMLYFTAVINLSQNEYVTVYTSQTVRGMQSYFTGHLVG